MGGACTSRIEVEYRFQSYSDRRLSEPRQALHETASYRLLGVSYVWHCFCLEQQSLILTQRVVALHQAQDSRRRQICYLIMYS